MGASQLRSILESLLFVVEEPLTIQRMAEVLEGVEKKEIISALRELQAEWESARGGFRLVEVAGGYQLRTPKENAEWVKRLLRGRPARMSRASLETLAIIAYKQPITRAEVEAIRGVDVDGVLASLLERRLVRIVARKDVPGRPFLYGTTADFLELFNLKDLSHLPTLKEIEEIAAGSADPESPRSGDISPSENES